MIDCNGVECTVTWHFDSVNLAKIFAIFTKKLHGTDIDSQLLRSHKLQKRLILFETTLFCGQMKKRNSIPTQNFIFTLMHAVGRVQ